MTTGSKTSISRKKTACAEIHFKAAEIRGNIFNPLMSLWFFFSKIRVYVSNYTFPKAMTDQSTQIPEFFLTLLFMPSRALQVDTDGQDQYQIELIDKMESVFFVRSFLWFLGWI